MANGADGSIRIDTTLDNSGFEKGSDKLLSSLKGIESAVEAISDTLSDGFASVIKSLQSMTSNASGAYQTMREEASETAGANEQVVQSMQTVQQATQSAATNTGTSGRRVTSTYDGIYKSAGSLQDQLQKLATTASIGFKNEGQAQRFRDSVDSIARKVEDLRSKLEMLGEAKIPTEAYASLQIELEKAKVELDTLIKKEEEWASMGFEGKGSVWDDLIEKEATVSDRIDEIKTKMAEMVESGTAFSSAPGFEQAKVSVDGLSEKLESVRQAGQEAAVGLQQAGSQAPSLSVLAVFAKSAGNAIQNMAKSIINTGIRAFHSVVNKLGSALKNVASGAKNAAKNLLSFGRAANAGKTPVDTLVRALTSFKSLLITRIKRTFISQIFQDLQQGIQNFARYSAEFNNAMSNIKNAGTQVANNIAVTFANLVTLLEPIITRILSLVNTLLSALNAVFSLLTGKKVVPTATAQTGSYADSLDNAAGSAGNAASAQKKLNRELYSWDELNRQNDNDSGGSGSGGNGGGGGGLSWTDTSIDDVLPQAIKDWVEKLKKLWGEGDFFGVGEHIATAMNAGLKKLDGWINNTFRPWAVKWAKNIAEVLNGVVAGLDWKLLGKTFSDGVAAILDAGATFLETFDFAELGKGLSKALQGVFENRDMWHQLARFLSDAFNGMVDLAWGFIKESLPHLFDWGYTLSRTLSETLDNINWQKLAETIVMGFEGICRFVEGWLAETANWESFKQKFTDAFSYVVNNVDMARLGTDISNLMIRFLDLLAGLDWYSFGYQIGQFLGNIDWPTIIWDVLKIIGEAVKGAIVGFFSSDHGWSSLLAFAGLAILKNAGALLLTLLKIKMISAFLPQLVSTILPGFTGAVSSVATGTEAAVQKTGLFSKIGGAIKSGASSLIGVIKANASKIGIASLGVADALILMYDYKKLSESYKGYKEAMNAHTKETETALSNFKKLYETKGPEVAAEWAKTCYQIDTSGMSLEQGQKALAGKVESLWDGVPQSMWEGFKQGVSQWISNGNLFSLIEDGITGLIDGAKSLLGINSPSTVFMAIGSDVIQGLFNGISGAWNAITGFFETSIGALTSFVSGAWENIKTLTGTAWEGIKTTVSTAWEGIKTGVSTAVSAVKTGVSTGWENIKSATSTAWSVIKSATSTTWSNIKSTVSTAATNIQSTVSSKFSQAKTALTTAVTGMLTSAKTGWTNMKTAAATKFNEILSTTKTTMNSATSFLRGISWSGIASNLVGGFSSALSRAWSGVTSWVSSAASAVTNTLKNALRIGSPSKLWMEIGNYAVEGLKIGMEDESENALDVVSNLAEGLTDRVESISGSFESMDNTSFASLDTAYSKLAQIVDVIQGITDALSSMGGLKVPQIAAGAVIPQTVIAAESAGNYGYTDQDTTGTRILDAMQNILQYLQNGNGQEKQAIVVSINGREVMNAVVEENNRDIVRTGKSRIKV